MRTFRILLGASFLFFCTTLMHAGHVAVQDPSVLQNSTIETTDSFTLNNASSDLFSFLNLSPDNWHEH